MPKPGSPAPEQTPEAVAALLEALAAGPRRIAAAVRGVPDDLLHRTSPAEPWSVRDIVAHLRSSDDVRTRFIRALLAQEKPALRHVSARSELKTSGYLALPFASCFEGYVAAREQLVALLSGLSAEAWVRSAEIKGRVETVFQYTQYVAQHEAPHCEQIERLVQAFTT